jgi:hypothetical protein
MAVHWHVTTFIISHLILQIYATYLNTVTNKTTIINVLSVFNTAMLSGFVADLSVVSVTNDVIISGISLDVSLSQRTNPTKSEWVIVV